MDLEKQNSYPACLIYNIDETSLLIKKPVLPSMAYCKNFVKPSYQIDRIFSATAVFIGFSIYLLLFCKIYIIIKIVDADGGSAQTTLIINEKMDLKMLEDFVPLEIDIRFKKSI